MQTKLSPQKPNNRTNSSHLAEKYNFQTKELNFCFYKHAGIDRAASSYKVRVKSRNHLAAFIKKCYKRSDISMLELTPDFIKEYEIYLSTDAGLHNGSVWSHCM